MYIELIKGRFFTREQVETEEFIPRHESDIPGILEVFTEIEAWGRKLLQEECKNLRKPLVFIGIPKKDFSYWSRGVDTLHKSLEGYTSILYPLQGEQAEVKVEVFNEKDFSKAEYGDIKSRIRVYNQTLMGSIS